MPASESAGDGDRPRSTRSLLWRGLGIAVVLALIAYGAAAAYLFTIQRSLVFRPNPERVAPAAVGLAEAEERLLSTPGAPTLVSWWIAPGRADRPVILYLHGNAANLARRTDRFRLLTADGTGLLALSWRGYGGSEGRPSEWGFRADAQRALDELRVLGIPPERVVLFGESLGTGIAVMLAADAPIRALILDSPYDSIQAIAAQRYPFIPVGLLMLDPFRADRAAPRVRQPALVIQCREDWATPYENGRRLLTLLSGPTRHIVHPRRCHVPSLAGESITAIRALLAGS